ncbi:MFS transporter, ACS family, hexuronate transporter [Chitinophaga sp. YR627]|nr:MFS transporter, ACS family, hexuronate transporter [Chitinophaga sp. YR627]
MKGMDSTKIGKYRWSICALLFFATTINYIDRQVIGLLKPILSDQFEWTEKDFGGMMSAFSAAYAVGLLVFGRLVDKIGTKMGYILSIVVWSFAAMGHALAKTTMGFGIARVLLGLGESGNFPVAIKTVAEWFPKKERALATGIFNSGANIGAVIAPIVVPWLAGTYGWQHAFIWTGIIGFAWLVFWVFMYEIPARHKKLTQAEFDYIHSDDVAHTVADGEIPDGVKPVTPAAVAAASTPPEKKSVSWTKLLGVRQTWAFVFGKLLTDPIWWFFLFWLPSYFATTFNLDFKKPNLQLFVIYTATTVGSIGGGYLSSWLINKGWPVFRARKTSMLLFAICVVPIMFAKSTNNIWVVVGLISLAAAAHQAWSANIFTTASDMFPKHAVSSVVGIGGMAGSIGGSLFPIFAGFLLDYYKEQGNIGTGYNILFLISGSMYLLAWLIMHLFAPKMEQVKL